MADAVIPNLNGNGPVRESSRLRKAVNAYIVVTAIALAAAVVTGDYQPVAVLLALAVTVLISWLWSVAVDRAFHRYREWSKGHSPQPVVQTRERPGSVGARLPMRPITSGAASLSFENLLKQGAIPLVFASADSPNPDERVAALKIEASQSLQRLARELESAGRSQEAGEAASLSESVARLGPASAAGGETNDLSRALDLVAQRRFDEAIPRLEELREKSPSGAVLYSLGTVQGASADFVKSAALLRQAAEAGAESAQLRLALGAATAEQGDYVEAAKQLRAAAAMDPDLGAAHAALGEVLAATGETSEAREALENALSLDPSSILARSAMGRLLYERGNPAGAARELAAACEEAPDDPDLAYNYAVALSAAGSYDNIIAVLEPRVSELHDPQIVEILAEAYEKKGQPAKARELLAASSEVMPATETSRLKLAQALREEGKIEQAEEELRQLVRDNPRSAEAMTELGLIVEARGDEEQALNHYRAALQVNRSSASALTEAGRLLLKQGQTKEAMGMLRAASSLPDASADAYHWLGEAHLRAGKPLLAMQALRQAARASGNRRGDISYALGRSLLEAGRDREAAEELRRTRKLLPGRPEVERDLGYALHKTRNYPQAAACFKAYLESVPDAADAADVRRLADSL